ncbi:MAG: DUF4250 domain-containing protein [Lachnospiraceae bacterium]|nr:DUF4250 domain-containing protein [Lachnospiraceae bacterium]
MDKMPKDPVMLLSFVNMKLRDYYQDLESLCRDYEITMKELSGILDKIGYRYDKTLNRFITE